MLSSMTPQEKGGGTYSLGASLILAWNLSRSMLRSIAQRTSGLDLGIRSLTNGCLIVTLAFSDRKYLSAAAGEENVEYLCGDLLQELTVSLPSLKDLRLLQRCYTIFGD